MAKKYHLEIDSSILEILGPNLYTNIYFVLAELIANSWDADAKNVYISFSDDEIKVEDDGKGMSYKDGGVNKYLNVALSSRIAESDAKTEYGRLKMGRKGIGKLAALAVSSQFSVHTITREGERSGFILTSATDKNNDLEEIPDEKVVLQNKTGQGTAIVMPNPKFKVNSRLETIARNLVKIFPLAGEDFQIHLNRGQETFAVASSEEHLMGMLVGLITLGDEFAGLKNHLRKEDQTQAENRQPISKIVLVDSKGVEVEVQLEIKGWIGVYRSTRGTKKLITDFSDNAISLFANGKLGEFNILQQVGQNKLNEVYVVGRLHVDVFERTDLPDMALSNRQGYRSDDPRYQVTLEEIRKLLPDVLRIRDKYADSNRAEKVKAGLATQEKREKELRDSVNKFRQQVIESTVNNLGSPADATQISAAVSSGIDSNLKEIGLKRIDVDKQKKKILISHTRSDKNLGDVLEAMLLFNRVSPSDILYTNSDNELSRIPEDYGIYQYLQNFFVDSYSTEKIIVLFITSEEMSKSWGAVIEVGAAWITKADHKIFNIHPFRPGLPLNVENQWHTTVITDSVLTMSRQDADQFCVKLESVVTRLKLKPQSRDQNMTRLSDYVEITNV